MSLIDNFVETDLVFGDWVIHENGDKTRIGRIAHPKLHGTAEVIFSTSCKQTEELPLSELRKATLEEISKAPNGIGYNRFKGQCLDRNDDECWFCCAKRPKTEEELKKDREDYEWRQKTWKHKKSDTGL